MFNQCDLEPNATVPTPTPLCKHHYQVLYNKIHPMQTHCITCGSSLRHTKSKTCNQPNVIELYLKEKAGFEGTIKEGDKVCYVCYRSHLVILDTMDSEQTSTDSELYKLYTGQHPSTKLSDRGRSNGYLYEKSHC